MLIKLFFDSDVPIYMQMRNEIVKGIATKQLALGESLPTVRQMADDAGVNPMTVNKAYGLLKQEGYIVVDRRHGAKVAQSFPIGRAHEQSMQETLALVVCEAKLAGIDEDQMIDRIKTLYRQLI